MSNNKLTPSPTAKAKLLSHLIEELQVTLKNEGDMEVFITNEAEACFDGVGGSFIFASSTKGEKGLALMRSSVVIKIQ